MSVKIEFNFKLNDNEIDETDWKSKIGTFAAIRFYFIHKSFP